MVAKGANIPAARGTPESAYISKSGKRAQKLTIEDFELDKNFGFYAGLEFGKTAPSWIAVQTLSVGGA
jgi:hypothetical protein